MPDCECLPRCPFFNDRMPDDTGRAAIFKRIFCLGDSHQCARRMISQRLGREQVPYDLYPHQTERVEEILRSAV